MPKRHEFEENQYYHVYNRGRHKQTLFHDKYDFQRFLRYIDLYKEKCKETIGLIAYNILPNHFHFVLHNKSLSHTISYFIGNVCASYTRYYKAKYSTGKGFTFFESRFKSKLLSNESYLNQCIHYVEFNAIKHGLVEDNEDWIFSSYDRNKKGFPDREILDIDWEFS